MKDWSVKNSQLLDMALTHKSYANENKLSYDNEKLEFIGDAVVDLVVGEMLYHAFPEENEGRLSKKRASLVNEEVLAKKAMLLNLQNVLKLGKGETFAFLSQKSINPRLMASAFEAVVGALYLDQGFIVTSTWLKDIFHEDLKNFGEAEVDYEKDYKSRLQEHFQKNYKSTPIYVVKSESGLAHEKIFEVALIFENKEWARGCAPTKKMAEQQAAKTVLLELRKNGAEFK